MHADAPPVTPAALFYMRLFHRIERWKALPGAGGILDQDELLMRRLDTIADVIEEHRAKQAREDEQRRANNLVLAQLGRR